VRPPAVCLLLCLLLQGVPASTHAQSGPMPGWLPTAYYALDLLLALAFPLVVWGLRRRGTLHRRAWSLFWMGAALGLAWEVPIFAMSAWTELPIVRWPAPLPAHPVVFIVAHSLWDGALLLGGYGLAVLLEQRTGRAPTSAPGLLVQLGWGQVFEEKDGQLVRRRPQPGLSCRGLSARLWGSLRCDQR